MNIEFFCRQYGSDLQPIDDVVRSWRAAQIDRLLDDAIASGVVLTDATLGDGSELRLLSFVDLEVGVDAAARVVGGQDALPGRHRTMRASRAAV